MNIEITDLAIGYQRHQQIIKPLDLTIQAGERIGIIGESGAGEIYFAQRNVRRHGAKLFP